MTNAPEDVLFLQFKLGTRSNVFDVIANVRLPIDVDALDGNQADRLLDVAADRSAQYQLSGYLERAIQERVDAHFPTKVVVRNALITGYNDGTDRISLLDEPEIPRSSVTKEIPPVRFTNNDIAVLEYLQPYVEADTLPVAFDSNALITSFLEAIATPFATWEMAIGGAADLAFEAHHWRETVGPANEQSQITFNEMKFAQRAAVSAFINLSPQEKPAHITNLVEQLRSMGAQHRPALDLAITVETYRAVAKIEGTTPLLGKKSVKDPVVKSLREAVYGETFDFLDTLLQHNDELKPQISALKEVLDGPPSHLRLL